MQLLDMAKQVEIHWPDPNLPILARSEPELFGPN